MEKRELEDFEIEVTITTQLSKDDILHLEQICGRQLDTLELLLFSRATFSFTGISITLGLLNKIKTPA